MLECGRKIFLKGDSHEIFFYWMAFTAVGLAVLIFGTLTVVNWCAPEIVPAATSPTGASGEPTAKPESSRPPAEEDFDPFAGHFLADILHKVLEQRYQGASLEVFTRSEQEEIFRLVAKLAREKTRVQLSARQFRVYIDLCRHPFPYRGTTPTGASRSERISFLRSPPGFMLFHHWDPFSEEFDPELLRLIRRYALR
jgi:hypothetical protein